MKGSSQRAFFYTLNLMLCGYKFTLDKYANGIVKML
jgi:hypothetical protein